MSQSLELRFRIQTEGRQQLEAVVNSLKGVSLEVRSGSQTLQQFDLATKKVTDGIRRMERSLSPLQDNIMASVLKANLLTQGIERAASFTKDYTIEATRLAARTGTLTVVLDQLARVNNLSVGASRSHAAAVKALGITTEESLTNINKMIFAQLDLRHATDVARLAQNAAVIANMNSSQALTGILHGITTRQPEVLRTYGIIVNFEHAFVQAARQRGRALAEIEKTEIALHQVLKEGVKIAGAYEAAMLTTGKQLTSLPRYVEEAKAAIGEQFVPVLGRTITSLTRLNELLTENAEETARSLTGVTALGTAWAAFRFTPGPLPLRIAAGTAAGIGVAGLLNPSLADQVEDQQSLARSAVAKVHREQSEMSRQIEKPGLTKADADALKRRFEESEASIRLISQTLADNLAQLYIKAGKSVGREIMFEAERLAQGADLGAGVQVSRGDVLAAIRARKSEDTAGPTANREAFERAVAEAEAAEAGEKAKEHAKKAAQRLIERNQQMTRLLDSLDKGGLDPLARLILDMRQNLRDLVQRYGKLTASEAEEVTRGLRGRFARERAGEVRKTPLETIPFEQPGALAFWASRPAVAQSVQVDPAANEAILQRFRDRSLASLHREMQYRERMIALLAGPGGERAAIEQIAQVREEAALREFQITKDRHALEERLDQNRKDRIIAIAELQKRQLEQYRETAGRVFDALTARGGSGGLRDFLAGQAKILERQIFVNASAGIFRQAGGMLGRVGAASGLGGLLAGTIFDPQNANPAEATLDNTRETRRNTDELRRLRITFQGGTTGGVPAGLSLLDSFRTGPTADQTLRMLGGALGREAAGSPGLARKLQDALQGSSPARGAQNLLAGLASPLSAGLFAGVRGGDYSIALGGGRATTASALGLTSTAGRIGNLVGSGALVGLGTLGVVSGIREGGARGATTAVGSALGVASAIPGPQQPILQAAALVAGLVRGMFGDPKDQRRRSLERDLEGRRFTEPEGAEYATDIYGRKVDSDFRGRLRAVPQINVTINAMDASTFRDFARSNPVAFSEAVTAAIQSGNGEDLVGTLRQTLT